MGQLSSVFVSGCSSGFGRLIVETLARHGHTTVAGMRDPSGKNRTAAAVLRAYFGSAVIEGRSQSPSMVKAISILRRIGALWQGGIDDVYALSKEVGLSVREHLDTTALHDRLASTIDLGADARAEYGVCLLGSAKG